MKRCTRCGVLIQYSTTTGRYYALGTASDSPVACLTAGHTDKPLMTWGMLQRLTTQ